MAYGLARAQNDKISNVVVCFKILQQASLLETLAGFLAGSGLAVILPQPACLLPDK